ncbi:RING finger protein 10, partial [Rhizophlyctis rosea]
MTSSDADMAQLYQSRAPRLNANAPEFMPGPSTKASAKEAGSSSSAGKGRRSAPPSQSPVPKNQNNNRNQQQKNESRPRKQQQRRQEPRQTRQEEVLYEDSAISAANNWGSPNKRGAISLNHLLNFSLPPRQRPTPGSSGPVRRKKDVYYEPYNKERFVNANYRFVMDEGGDYTVNLFDPDVIVEWENIVQATVPITKPLSCPICLGTPTAPKVTKCGHVYCWPCILHYLHLGEKKWRKCPICYDAIYAKDLKSAQFTMAKELGKATIGKPVSVDMMLMQRATNSTVTLPRAAYRTWSSNQSTPPSVANANAVPYAKLLLSSPEYRQSQILEREQRELRGMIAEADNEAAAAKLLGVEARGGMASERPFVEVALTEVKETIETISKKNALLRNNKKKASKQSLAAEVVSVPAPVRTVVPQTTEAWSLDEAAQRYRESSVEVESAFSEDEKTPRPEDTRPRPVLSSQPAVSETSTIAKAPAKTNVPPKDGMYYFYQGADGQHLYLHPLDIKVLKYEYGEYDNFPDRIAAKAIHAQESTVNEDLRKRCKYLSHLPLSCDVNFCEIDLSELVSEATLKTFEKELSARTRKYKAEERKEAQEKRRSTETYGRSLSTSPNAFIPEHFDSEFPAELNPRANEYDSGASVTSSIEGTEYSRSPEFTTDRRTPPAQAPPNLGKVPPSTGSFARIAAATTSSSQLWTRRAGAGGGGSRRELYHDDDDEYLVDDYQGWTLDFEEAVMVDGAAS